MHMHLKDGHRHNVSHQLWSWWPSPGNNTVSLSSRVAVILDPSISIQILEFVGFLKFKWKNPEKNCIAPFIWRSPRQAAWSHRAQRQVSRETAQKVGMCDLQSQKSNSLRGASGGLFPNIVVAARVPHPPHRVFSFPCVWFDKKCF